MSWKDNLALSIAVCITTAIAIGGFFWGVVLPIMETSNENKIEELNKHKSSLINELKSKNDQIDLINTKNKKEQERLLGKIGALEQDVSSLQQSNSYLRHSNLFSIEDTYPIDFRKVRIGDIVERVIKVYNGYNIENKKSWYSIDVDNELFSQITYYKGSCNNKNVVTHILFHFNDNYDFGIDIISGLPKSETKKTKQQIFDLIYNQLMDKYGHQFVTESVEDGLKEWHFETVGDHLVSLDERSLLIRKFLPQTDTERQKIKVASMKDWVCYKLKQ